MKGFKYQITVNILLSKEKRNGEIEYSSVYFNSLTNTVINLEFNLDKSFQEIDNWINEGSGWIIKSIDGEYVNISKYTPLIRKDYCKVERQNNIYISVFCYGNKIIYPLYISSEKFSNSMDLLLIFEENKSHYLYIKDFNRLMFNKTKNKNKT